MKKISFFIIEEIKKYRKRPALRTLHEPLGGFAVGRQRGHVEPRDDVPLEVGVLVDERPRRPSDPRVPHVHGLAGAVQHGPSVVDGHDVDGRLGEAGGRPGDLGSVAGPPVVLQLLPEPVEGASANT